jgi:hypothetical protein
MSDNAGVLVIDSGLNMLTFTDRRWTKSRGCILAALLTGASLLSCGGGRRDFPPLGPVTTANLWITANDGSKYGWKISDPKDVSRIVIFVDSQRANWVTPWYGIPVPFVEVQLFDGQKAQGSFGVGQSFFETQREGSFFSKSAATRDIRGFFDALNLDDATVKEFRNKTGGGKPD